MDQLSQVPWPGQWPEPVRYLQGGGGAETPGASGSRWREWREWREPDTGILQVAYPQAAIVAATSLGYVVTLASDAELQLAWERVRGRGSRPLGRLLVLGSVSADGCARRIWLARSCLESYEHRKLAQQAIERLIYNGLRDVTWGSVLVLVQHGKLLRVPYIFRRYQPTARFTPLTATLSWVIFAALALLMRLQVGRSVGAGHLSAGRLPGRHPRNTRNTRRRRSLHPARFRAS